MQYQPTTPLLEGEAVRSGAIQETLACSKMKLPSLYAGERLQIKRLSRQGASANCAPFWVRGGLSISEMALHSANHTGLEETSVTFINHFISYSHHAGLAKRRQALGVSQMSKHHVDYIFLGLSLFSDAMNATYQRPLMLNTNTESRWTSIAAHPFLETGSLDHWPPYVSACTPPYPRL